MWKFINLVALAVLAVLMIMPRAVAVGNGEMSIDIGDGWNASSGAPAAVALRGARGGVAFESVGIRGEQRSYWDKSVDLNLAGKELFELDVLLAGAENISQISLHFRSGKGWYSASKNISGLVASFLQFDMQDFKAEGGPAGWDKIDKIRISIWRVDKGGTARMHLYRFLASNPVVLIVKDGSERRKDALSEKSASEVGNWLISIDVPVRTIYADDLDLKMLSGRSLLVLPYNPNLGAREMRVIEAFLESGGRLFSFYSDKPALARAMGFKLGGYMSADEHFPWMKLEFSSDAGQAFPAVVYQRATAVIPAYPDSRSARVLASWNSRRPSAATPPALLESRRGFWMTQIPRKYDALAKRQMMACAVGRMVPELAPRIARRMLEMAGQVDSFRNVPAASLSMREVASRRGDGSHALRCIAAADTAYRAAQSNMLKGRYESALASAIKVRDSLERAYADLHPLGLSRIRGVWDHHGVGLYPGDWDKTCRLLSAAGINALFPNMLNDGHAHYDSKVLNRSKTCADLGDQIEQCVAAANKYNMQVHIWKVCWKLDGAPPAYVDRLEREGRLQIDKDGKVLPWLNPAHPANRRLALDSIVELVRKYDIDGVHLDYIRYGWNSDCCSPYTRKVFEQWLGNKTDWPRDILSGGKYRAKYGQWKVEQISSFVAEAYRKIKAVDPKVQLSAAVIGGYPECVSTVSQDWRAWLADGTIDFVAPMNYTDSLEFLGELLDSQAKMPNAASRIYPGIGVSSSQSSLSPSDVIEQSRLISSKGFSGQVFFDLDAEFEGRILPFLKAD